MESAIARLFQRRSKDSKSGCPVDQHWPPLWTVNHMFAKGLRRFLFSIVYFFCLIVFVFFFFQFFLIFSSPVFFFNFFFIFSFWKIFFFFSVFFYTLLVFILYMLYFLKIDYNWKHDGIFIYMLVQVQKILFYLVTTNGGGGDLSWVLLFTVILCLIVSMLFAICSFSN